MNQPIKAWAVTHKDSKPGEFCAHKTYPQYLEEMPDFTVTPLVEQDEQQALDAGRWRALQAACSNKQVYEYVRMAALMAATGVHKRHPSELQGLTATQIIDGMAVQPDPSAACWKVKNPEEVLDDVAHAAGLSKSQTEALHKHAEHLRERFKNPIDLLNMPVSEKQALMYGDFPAPIPGVQVQHVPHAVPVPIKQHPTQPIVSDPRGVLRFKENAIVCYLVNSNLGVLNRVAAMSQFSREDRVQLNQLLGYSVRGWCGLSCVEDSDVGRLPTGWDKP